ncbi:hypothetical protein PABY_24120 [Pyrodictium abyssi]|uniref:Uncharacterized protein n=1 Tax=Pyrodictium abyssi TaxID=54256 RepID=A0ABM8J0J1_9CREN|nr:hypothetical protein PABY_24120 [Pyrodictium abyssi]
MALVAPMLLPGGRSQWFRGGTVLFDPRPKTSRSELFDRERELEILYRAVERG